MSDETFRGFSPEEMEKRSAGHMFDKRVRLLEQCLQKYVPAHGIVGDVGMATGNTVASLFTKRPDITYYGVDMLHEYVKYAQKVYSPQDPAKLFFQEGIAQKLPWPDHQCHLIYAMNLFHHIPPDQLKPSALEIHRVLKPGGIFVSIEPNCWQPYIFLYQGLTQGERNFLPWREQSAIKKSFSRCLQHKFYFLLPAFIKKPADYLIKIESLLESFFLFGGSVVSIYQK